MLHDLVFKFSPEGIKVCALDGARCALVSLNLEADKFETFLVPSPVNCGVSLSHLQKCIKSATPSDTTTFLQPASAPNELHIHLKNAQNKTSTSFILKLMDLDDEVIQVPSMDFEWSTTLSSVYLQRLCRDMSQLGETLTLEARSRALVFEVKGDFASQRTEVSTTEIGSEMAADEIIRENYPIKYITMFCRASQISNVCQINMRAGYPLVLSYNVAGLGVLRFVLAPKLVE